MIFDSKLSLEESERLLDAIQGFLAFVENERAHRRHPLHEVVPYSMGEVEARMHVKIDPRLDYRLRGIVERQVAK